MSDVLAGTPVLVTTNPPFQSLLTSPATPVCPTTVSLVVSVNKGPAVTFTWSGGVDPTETITLVDGTVSTFQAILDTTPGAIFDNPVGTWVWYWVGTGALKAVMQQNSFTVGNPSTN